MEDDKSTVSQDSTGETRTVEQILKNIELLLLRLLELAEQRPIVWRVDDYVMTMDGRDLDPRLVAQLQEAQQKANARFRQNRLP